MESEPSLIAYFDPSIGKDALLAAIEEYGAIILYEYRNINGVAFRIPEGKFIGDAIEFFQNVDGVLSVQKDTILHTDNF